MAAQDTYMMFIATLFKIAKKSISNTIFNIRWIAKQNGAYWNIEILLISWSMKY